VIQLTPRRPRSVYHGVNGRAVIRRWGPGQRWRGVCWRVGCDL